MTLRICHLVSGDLWAGAEVMVFHLLRGLSGRPDIDLFVVLLNNGRLADELSGIGVPTRVLDERKLSFREIVGMTAKAAREWAPDVLHSHRYKENLLSFLASLALKKKATLLSTQHGMPELYGHSPGLLRRLKLHANFKLLASRFDKTVAVSEDIRQTLAKTFGFRNGQLETIRNGIVLPALRDRREHKDPFVIGSAGRLVSVKDYPLMIEVARRVCAKCGNIRFELAGDGPMLGDIRSLIGKHGLDGRFLLRGFIQDIDTYYDQLDVYLSTSLHEGISLSILEAMAHGVPPVAPRVGGFEEIVTDGVDGYLVGGRSPDEFSEKCLALFSNDALRKELGYAAREKVRQRFSVERMVQEYLDMYARSSVGRAE